MLALGVVIALASVPGWTSISLPAGWAALSILLPATLWRPARLTGLHLLFLAILTWATIGLLWASSALDGLYRLWELGLLFLAFRLGSSLTDISSLIRGLAYGCLVSTAFAIAQWLGYQPLMAFSTDTHAGLFFNPSIAGQTIALVAIACLAFDRWTFAISLLPGVALSGSRGGLLVLALGFAFNLCRSRLLLAVTILAGLTCVLLSGFSHDLERSLIWRGAFHYLSPFGNGPGSFISLYVASGDRLIHPTDVHNDLLQIVFELGIPGALGFIGLFACVLRRTDRPEWPLLAAFTLLSFFAFPLFVPISGFLLALCAGRVAGCGNLARTRVAGRRLDLLPWRDHWPNLPDPTGSDALPTLTRTP